jgi:hypothetical protein
MNFIKKLFGLKEKDNTQLETSGGPDVGQRQVNKIPDNEQLPESQRVYPTGEEETCDVCQMPIYGEQKVVHKFGKAYHSKPCFRQLMKEAKKHAFG